MIFLEKTKRFLEPVKYRPIIYIKSVIEGIIDGLYLVSSLYFFEKIGTSIHQNSMGLFYEYLWIYSIIMGLYFIFKCFSLHWWWVDMYIHIEKVLTDVYLNRFIQAEPNIVEKIGTGRFIAIHKKASHVWLETIHGFLSNDLALIVVSIYWLIRISQFNTIYGISVILSLIIVLVTTYFLDKNYTIPSRKIRTEAESEYWRLLARIFMSKNEYLQGNQFSKDKENIYWILKAIRDSNWILERIIWWMFIVIRIIWVSLRFFVYLFIWIKLFWSNADFWTFSMYIMIVGIIEGALRTLYDTFRKFTREFHHLEKFWSTFDSLTPIKWYDSWITFSPKPKDIIIKNISYGYNESKVFSDFSLTIKRWKKTALVGASGGWKTTLMKLIAGYLHPDSWSISVMGNTLSETALKSYYPHIGYLTQDPSVFDATIRENLASAVSDVSSLSSRRDPFQNQVWEKDNPNLLNEWKRDSSLSLRNDKGEQEDIEAELEQKLISALKLAHCDFVFEMEKWLDTEIWERGVRLSGGQKQRLAIAKIFLKDPEIILLDEPTSALDSFSEEQITKALDELFRDRTVIVIAHRLQTVKKADEIIVIEAGEVIESWDHKTLVAKWGIYYRMLELQSGF